MKRFLPLILVICLLLCACGKTEEETTPATTESTEMTVESTRETKKVPETTQETVATEPVDVNPLTGEALEEENNCRPFAIMLNNKDVSLPHCGVGEADLLYETLVEGAITRCMAVFSDPENAGAIGSIRSARPPFISLVQCYDAIYSSASGADNVLGMIRQSGVDYMNALYDNPYFYRDSYRKNYVGYEHSLFVTGEGLKSYAEDFGYRTTREREDFGFHFDDSKPFSGEPVETIKLWFQSGGKSTTVNYDEDKGVFYLNQYGMDYVDGNTNELVPFRNIFILYCNSYTMDNGVHVQVESVGEGKGYYARDGKIVPILWSRESEDAPFVYTLEDGTELTMGVGKSYFALIDKNSDVIYE